MSLIHVEVKNWDSYNERATRSNYTWFKFSNTYFSDPKFFAFSMSARVSFIFILCERSKSKKNCAEINTELMATYLRSTEQQMINDIEELCASAVLCRVNAAECREVVESSRHHAHLDKSRLDKKRKEKKRVEPDPAHAFDFVSVAKKFPNAKGRSIGVKRLVSLILTQESFDSFSKAVDNYAEQCRLDATPTQFIKHFSSFVGTDSKGHPWEDWVDVVPTASPQGGQRGFPTTPKRSVLDILKEAGQ